MNWFLLLSYGKQLNYHLSSITLFLFLVTMLPPINSVLLHNTMPKPLEMKIPSYAVTMGYRSNCQISYLLRTVFFTLLPSYLFVCCGVDLNGFNQQLFKLLVFKVTNLSYIQTFLSFFFFAYSHNLIECRYSKDPGQLLLSKPLQPRLGGCRGNIRLREAVKCLALF